MIVFFSWYCVHKSHLFLSVIWYIFHMFLWLNQSHHSYTLFWCHWCFHPSEVSTIQSGLFYCWQNYNIFHQRIQCGISYNHHSFLSQLRHTRLFFSDSHFNIRCKVFLLYSFFLPDGFDVFTYCQIYHHHAPILSHGYVTCKIFLQCNIYWKTN